MSSSRSLMGEGPVRHFYLPPEIGAFFLIFALAMSGGAPAMAQPLVSVATSLERLSPTAAPPSRTSAALYAAKGEYESFQIVVRGPASGLTNVNVTTSDLKTVSGATIPKSAFTLYREYYVYISQPVDTWHTNRPLGPGWYPDGLVPFLDPATGLPPTAGTIKAAPFKVAANNNQPVWVDVLVPRTATAGVYTGVFTITSTQGTATVPVTLTVWNFELPSKPSLKSNFNYWAGSADGATFLSTATRRVHEELLRNRLMPTTVPTANERAFIDAFGMVNTTLPIWSGADQTNCTMSPAPSVATIQNLVAQQQPDLKLAVNIADEIGGCPNLFEPVKQWARNLHAAGVSSQVVIPPNTALFDDGSGAGRSAVDIWTELPMQYDANTTVTQQAIQKGDQVWSYNTLMQDQYSPKWQVDYAPLNYRIQPGFISQSLGLTGLHYWRVDNWTSDPWNNVQNLSIGGYWYRGEGMLIYPGGPVGIVGAAPSMRLKYLRDGVDDFEYVQILKTLGEKDYALQIARSVGPDWRNWTKDPAVLEAARIQLGQEIERIRNGGAPQQPVAVAVSITSPTNGASVSGAVAVTTTASSSVVRVEFLLDGVVQGTDQTAPFSYNVNLSGAAAGSHTIGVTAYDAAGNKKSASVAVTVAAAGPSVSVLCPAAGASVEQAFTVTTAVSSSVVRVEFSVDGVYKGVSTAAPFSFGLSGLTLGAHTLTVVAYDAAWNMQIASVAFTAVLPGPTVSITSPKAGASVTGPVSVTTTVSSTVARVEFSVDGVFKGADTSAPFSYTISGLAAGAHTLTVVAYDASWKMQIVSVSFSTY